MPIDFKYQSASLLKNLQFQSFRTVLILDIQPRTYDCGMVGNEFAHGTLFIRRTAYQRNISLCHRIIMSLLPLSFHLS